MSIANKIVGRIIGDRHSKNYKEFPRCPNCNEVMARGREVTDYGNSPVTDKRKFLCLNCGYKRGRRYEQ